MKVTYEDHMGSDLKVVNAARVSFNKRSQWVITHDDNMDPIRSLNPADASLIQFLARGCTSGDWDALLRETSETTDCRDIEDILREVRSMPTHWTPFGHCQVTLIIKAPIFVARQLFKHKVGSVENEVSRRYVTHEPEFWTPEEWRAAASDKKQGSGAPMGSWPTSFAKEAYDAALNAYQTLLAWDICPEQARAVLPQATYTEWWVTGSLYYWSSLYNARIRKDAQKETQEIARQIGEIMAPLYPVSWEALTT